MMAVMDTLEFSKGHGTGNDFVIVPDPEGAMVLTPKLVRALCDRRFGIGADGVLRVVRSSEFPPAPRYGAPPPPTEGAEWFMDYRNADGSVAETCGNGIRVFARYLVETELVAADRLTIGTRAGVVAAVVTGDAVSVSMGLPRVSGQGAARVGGRDLPGTAVDCGNPHLVCPVPDARALADLDLTGPPVVDPALFPDGVNVEFTAPVDHHRVAMRVHERGVGETPSCGSGACAVAAATLRAAGQTGGVVTVDVPGGRLTVSLTGEECVLTGPAVLVAHGTVSLAALS
jgi:diaminopimelate epimerase